MRTRRVLEGLAPEHLDAGAGGNTIGTILYHLALIEADWLFAEILEEEFPPAIKSLLPVEDRDHQGVLTQVSGGSLEQHLARLSGVRDILLDRLRQLTDKDLHRVRSFPNYDASPAWVLHHLAQHEAEHRGELAGIISALPARG